MAVPDSIPASCSSPIDRAWIAEREARLRGEEDQMFRAVRDGLKVEGRPRRSRG